MRKSVLFCLLSVAVSALADVESDCSFYLLDSRVEVGEVNSGRLIESDTFAAPYGRKLYYCTRWDSGASLVTYRDGGVTYRFPVSRRIRSIERDSVIDAWPQSVGGGSSVWGLPSNGKYSVMANDGVSALVPMDVRAEKSSVKVELWRQRVQGFYLPTAVYRNGLDRVIYMNFVDGGGFSFVNVDGDPSSYRSSSWGDFALLTLPFARVRIVGVGFSSRYMASDAVPLSFPFSVDTYDGVSGSDGGWSFKGTISVPASVTVYDYGDYEARYGHVITDIPIPGIDNPSPGFPNGHNPSGAFGTSTAPFHAVRYFVRLRRFHPAFSADEFGLSVSQSGTSENPNYDTRRRNFWRLESNITFDSAKGMITGLQETPYTGAIPARWNNDGSTPTSGTGNGGNERPGPPLNPVSPPIAGGGDDVGTNSVVNPSTATPPARDQLNLENTQLRIVSALDRISSDLQNLGNRPIELPPLEIEIPPINIPPIEVPPITIPDLEGLARDSTLVSVGDNIVASLENMEPLDIQPILDKLDEKLPEVEDTTWDDSVWESERFEIEEIPFSDITDPEVESAIEELTRRIDDVVGIVKSSLNTVRAWMKAVAVAMAPSYYEHPSGWMGDILRESLEGESFWFLSGEISKIDGAFSWWDRYRLMFWWFCFFIVLLGFVAGFSKVATQFYHLAKIAHKFYS